MDSAERAGFSVTTTQDNSPQSSKYMVYTTSIEFLRVRKIIVFSVVFHLQEIDLRDVSLVLLHLKLSIAVPLFELLFL